MNCLILYISVILSLITLNRATPCKDLLAGQYICNDPVIDISTQEIAGCTREGIAKVDCLPLKGINCNNKVFNGSETGFQKDVVCRYTNGYSYSVAVALSMFLGWLGIDRFYLGYPAIGLLKFCTFGLFGIGALFDFLLIALQVVVPADGSNYTIDFYGPRLIGIMINDDTYYKSSEL